MTAPLPGTTREVHLVATPDTLPRPEHFAVVETALPERAPDQVLVRNTHFLVFPALLTLIGSDADDLPFPPLGRGDALFGPAVGQVLAAPEGGGVRPGDTVAHMSGWREHSLLPATMCTPVSPELPDPVAHLSQGSVAYGALTRLAAVREGDTVFVTGAAGAIGSMAGQIARLLGAGRVIGSTGSPRKAERLTAELGYDAVVLRGADRPLAAQLAQAAPDGVDVLLDTVGGDHLAAAVGAARQGARFALVGSLAGQLSEQRGGAVVSVDPFHLIIKGVSLRGYSGADHPDVEPEWTARFGPWLRSGAIRFPHVRIPGIERAPQALQELIEGRHVGAVVVEPAP
jgi:NADPH-dependent curcumin reductase CurA